MAWLDEIGCKVVHDDKKRVVVTLAMSRQERKGIVFTALLGVAQYLESKALYW